MVETVGGRATAGEVMIGGVVVARGGIERAGVELLRGRRSAADARDQ